MKRKAARRRCCQCDGSATARMAEPDGSFYSSLPPFSPNTCAFWGGHNSVHNVNGETFPGTLSLTGLRWASGWERTSSFTFPANEKDLSSLTAPEAPSPPDGRPVLFRTLSLWRSPVTGVNLRRSSHGGWSPGPRKRKWVFSRGARFWDRTRRKEGMR